MKRYFHTKINMYFIERDGTFYMDTGDGVEMELAYRPPMEQLLRDGIWIEIPQKSLEDVAVIAGIEIILEHVSNLFDEQPNAGSTSWDLAKLQAINTIRDTLEKYL